MSNPYLAQIKMWGCNFAPRDWAFCDGQLLSIATNTALFSLLGITYGGDGRTTFGLPNLQDRAALNGGQGPGLTPRNLGQVGGARTVTLNPNTMASHTHFPGGGTSGGIANPANCVWGTSQAAKAAANYYAPAGATVSMNANALAAEGGGQAHNNMMPFGTMNFCICLQGVYPLRN